MECGALPPLLNAWMERSLHASTKIHLTLAAILPQLADTNSLC